MSISWWWPQKKHRNKNSNLNKDVSFCVNATVLFLSSPGNCVHRFSYTLWLNSLPVQTKSESLVKDFLPNVCSSFLVLRNKRCQLVNVFCSQKHTWISWLVHFLIGYTLIDLLGLIRNNPISGVQIKCDICQSTGFIGCLHFYACHNFYICSLNIRFKKYVMFSYWLFILKK